MTNTNNLVSKQIRFKPPKTGAPTNRTGGASRRGDTCNTNNKSLKALLPENNFGLTIEEYPTFFVYIPASSAHLIEFELYEQDANEPLYKTIFKVPDAPGIVSFSLPNNQTLLPLEVGKNYRWFLSLKCNLQDSSENLYVQGSVQRIQPNTNLMRQLEKATPRDRLNIYAQAGIWHDTLTKLAELRRAHPDDKTLATDWTQLLESVGLNQVANAPIVYSTSVKASVAP
ncbi:DUF928 domain-containing protein [Nostoc sp. NIES-3756]|uniref:DUF928 domain-containing protein n=1 Tax=Nostoc sp. NIES-3756 TaxID=1751286 RepID=UPI0014951D1E|nr:DUF928 domain-containing protein [Nostoc sp. NIES-3756]